MFPPKTEDAPKCSPASLARDVHDLVSLPEVYVRIKQLVDDPTASLSDVAEAIAVDPGLTARLLRLANSAFFGLRVKIETVPRAITLLGVRQVHDFVLATWVMQSFAGIPPALVDMRQFWESSVLCGAAARSLARRCRVPESDRLFVVGLLAQVGRLVLYLRLPDLEEAILSVSERESRPIASVEREVLGFDYAAVGAELLASWSLPATLVEPIRHHALPAMARSYPLETAVIHVAVRLAEAPAECPEAGSFAASLDGGAWRRIGLPPEALPEVHAEAVAFAREAAELFLPSAR
ncbi:MAG: HDOD domain-containing protein [Gammaproteobacteria bacterium]|nr:HDOD domain-containing protein [Gammaproteobacteria bacterium]